MSTLLSQQQQMLQMQQQLVDSVKLQSVPLTDQAKTILHLRENLVALKQVV